MFRRHSGGGLPFSLIIMTPFLNDSLGTWEEVPHTTWITERKYSTLYEFKCQVNKKLGVVRVYLRVPFDVYTVGYTSVVGTVAEAYRPLYATLLCGSVNGQNYQMYCRLSSTGELSFGTSNDKATGSQHIVISGTYHIATA